MSWRRRRRRGQRMGEIELDEYASWQSEMFIQTLMNKNRRRKNETIVMKNIVFNAMMVRVIFDNRNYIFIYPLIFDWNMFLSIIEYRNDVYYDTMMKTKLIQ